MRVSVDWAKGDDYSAFVFFTKDNDGKVTICNLVVLSNGETELLRETFNRASASVELAATDSQQLKAAIALVRKAGEQFIPLMESRHTMYNCLDTIEQRAAV